MSRVLELIDEELVSEKILPREFFTERQCLCFRSAIDLLYVVS
jgi:hypothetical protein